MMEYFSQLLPIIIYVLLIVLIILLIIIAFKVIKALNKVQDIADNVEEKVRTLDGFFSVIDLATDKISSLSDRLIDIITGAYKKVTSKKSKKKIEKEDNKEDKDE